MSAMHVDTSRVQRLHSEDSVKFLMCLSNMQNQSTMQQQGPAIANLQNHLTNAANAAGNAVQAGFNSIKIEEATEQITDYYELISNIKYAFDRLPEVAYEVDDAGQQPNSDSAKSDTIFDKIKCKFISFKNRTKDSIDKFKGFVKEVGTKFMEALDSFENDFVGNATGTSGQIKEYVKEGLRKIADKLQSLIL
jgi:hypothetical protein